MSFLFLGNLQRQLWVLPWGTLAVLEGPATQMKANTELVNTANRAWRGTVWSSPWVVSFKSIRGGSAQMTGTVALGSLGSVGLGPSLGSGI